ncbi:MAG TPA: 2-keto-4-pentenoate hydratase, partial [Bradyrhizobium sp.]|nr:2-keto-4-pentenoate hydratase [Bradyrhizobium sp.]
MKLATLKDGSRDGTLVLVSRDLARAIAVPEIAPTLQAALDAWDAAAPRLEQLYARLNKGEIAQAVAFDPRQAHSPLPRAYQWADGSAYVNHVELVRRARGAT